MRSRIELSTLLRTILGSKNVYFQPPESKKLEYPCIVYKMSTVSTIHANNRPYRRYKRYVLTVMDPDPDSIIPDKIGVLPLCSFDRGYNANNLNHNVFNIYY